MPLAVFQDFCQQSAFFASRGVWKLYAHHHFYSKKRHRRPIDMPTIRRVAALGCYVVASTLLLVGRGTDDELWSEGTAVPQRRAQGADPRADRHAPAAGPARARGARLCGNQPVRRVHDDAAVLARSRVRNRHRHAIEQGSRRWRGGRRDDSARTRRKILISTQVPRPTSRRKSERSRGYLMQI